MAAMSLVIDEYLHLIVRTQPWDKKRFEGELARLHAWLAAQSDDQVAVEHLTAARLGDYLAALPETERPQAERAADSFLRWSRANGWISAHPLAIER